jgi:DNA-binding HxlR family transcriptional regulator
MLQVLRGHTCLPVTRPGLMVNIRLHYATSCRLTTQLIFLQSVSFGELNMNSAGRSGCPISLTLGIVGDKWSLLVIRDIIFDNRRHFRDLLTNSMEGIASNILADRLRRLVDQGILRRTDDASHKQKAIYSLTEKGIELLPVLAQMAAWGLHHLPVTNDVAARTKVLDQGGPKLWQQFMNELRELHLGAAPSFTRKASRISVSRRLEAAYQASVADAKRTG